MDTADTLSCQIADATEVICSMPPTSGWEMATAIGTIGATVSAVIFGISALVSARKERRKTEADRKRSMREEQFQLIISLMHSSIASFPLGPTFAVSRLERQRHIYLGYMLEGLAIEADIAHRANKAIAIFTGLAFNYSAVKNERASLYTQEGWVEENSANREMLEYIAHEFELALTQWHRTQDDSHGTIAHLEGLLEKAKSWIDKNTN